ncbi:hypothetical protein M427DRAFT_31958 [Gonapodya prolifera JEL478]|uniref:Hypervirulence associated protein TUDOR domain-containing protein n=1 Tax=Gonapodya prolifera (strain JEL478) TaxID=1344416 RepID=A0A139AGW6_GONPJ|nr:hypothetical protein M427DRAFT_31958 [Gonapodya prolifera JEL478]|eukprot:KXS16046.1 hypothetical protein M427DRAFT_31958 [Gonapodya prolifera JEL478]
MSQGKASIDDIQEGDKVQYFTIPGSGTHSTGVVEAILTEPQPAGSTGVTVKASEDEPRIVIKK